MSKEYAIVAKQISKIYKIYDSQFGKIKDLLFSSKSGKEFYALKRVSFTIEKGDSVGLIGLNGSGKSTLSNILAGISMPSEGAIEINGTQSLIAISSGLNMNLTGLENIRLKGLMIGLSNEEIEAKKNDIIEFADIGDFINRPVKTYSSGMKSRLGFAISINIDPDILIIDEALSVGDVTFSDKCLRAMNEFREKGKTIIFVSHSIGQINDFCNKVMWLEYGTIKAFGTNEEVVPMYNKFVRYFNQLSKAEQKAYRQRKLAMYENLIQK